MNIQEEKIISPAFRDNKVSHVLLTEKQKATRDRILDKINKGTYRFEASPCICDGNESITISKTDRYGIPITTVICKHCGLLRTDPKPDKEFLDDFYRNEYRALYTGNEYGDMDSYFLDMVERGGKILELVRKHAVSELKELHVLEIGCSAGGILLPFLKDGAVVKGYDYDKRYLDYGNNYEPSLNLNFGGFEDLNKEKNKYDLILINHVLEHLSDPELVVKITRNSLKSDGTLYLSVPGLKNPAYYFSPSKSFLGSLHISHLYHFNEASIMRLFKGFNISYMDDEVRSILKMKDDASDAASDKPRSKYLENLHYIQSYEKSLTRLCWRLKASIHGLLTRIKSLLPSQLVKALKLIIGK